MKPYNERYTPKESVSGIQESKSNRTERRIAIHQGQQAWLKHLKENETEWSATDLIKCLYDAGWRPVKQRTEEEFVVGVMRVIGPLSDDEIHPRQYLMDCLRELHRAGKCFVEVGYE